MLNRVVSPLQLCLRDDEALRALRGTLPEPADRHAWWRSLTTITQKWTEFSREAAFRESLADTQAVFGDRFEHVLQQVALLTVKPDGLAGGRAAAIVDFLLDNDFSIVHTAPVGYTPLRSRDLWRYQWNVATLDRLRLWDLLCAQGPALMLVVRDEAANPEVPAAVRLRGLKGPAIPEIRRPDTLRSAAASPNRILSMIHAADEPVDIIREIGIVFDLADRRAWLAAVAAAHRDRPLSRQQVDRAVAAVRADRPAVDFAFGPARDRLAAAWATGGVAHGPTPLDALLAVGQGPGFRAWTEEHAHLVDESTVWDVITVASHVIRNDELGEVCTIDDDGRPEWFAGFGRLLPRRRS